MRCSCGWRSRLIGSISILIFFCSSTIAFADLISPLTLSNYNPLVSVHGLPYAGDAEVLPRGSIHARLSYDVSSHYAYDQNDNEAVLLDGETARATFIYRQGIGHDTQISLVIPYIKHHSGGLDSSINDWHEIFGMPEGGRDLVANNQFRYFYRRNSQIRLNVRNSSEGVGDVRVQAAWQVRQRTDDASAMEVSVKLPTGNSEELHGSGAVDVAILYKHEAQQKLFGLKAGSFYSLGALYLGDGDVLADMRRPLVGFGGLGGGVYLQKNLLFISQLDINTAFYSSDLVELGSHTLQLSVGGSILFGDRGRINLGVAEDLVIDASPDVTFHMGVDWRF